MEEKIYIISNDHCCALQCVAKKHISNLEIWTTLKSRKLLPNGKTRSEVSYSTVFSFPSVQQGKPTTRRHETLTKQTSTVRVDTRTNHSTIKCALQERVVLADISHHCTYKRGHIFTVQYVLLSRRWMILEPSISSNFSANWLVLNQKIIG